MPTLKLRFPGGRYHATPWGHHVNEGLIEWPPSPWRLLRALIACGFSSQRWTDIPSEAQGLIHKLAQVLPSYKLPKASVAHSRHYMPIGVLDKGREKTTLVFDTWADVGDGELFVHWPCDLDEAQMALLRRLGSALGYLGRSESWVEAEMVPDGELNPEDFNAFPHREGMSLGVGYEQVSLMAPVSPEAYQALRATKELEVVEAYPVPEGKRKLPATVVKAREKALAPYPPDLLSCLVKDTGWWKGHGWSQPPGSHRILYWRRSDSLEVGIPEQRKTRAVQPVSMMLLSLTTPSRNRASLPPLTRTLPQAELFHQAIISRLGKGQKVHCPELTGRDENGSLLRGSHRHAHTIPLDLDGDGHLDHILVYAEMKLGGRAQRAIQEVRETWRKKGPELQVAVVGRGDLELLRKLPDRMKVATDSLLGPPGGSRYWHSMTPFVPPRYLKEKGKNSLMGQVNAELASRGLPEAREIHIDPELTRTLRHYVRRRGHGRAPQPPMDIGLGVRLVFEKSVSGPLALGYASHFGLGLFTPTGLSPQ